MIGIAKSWMVEKETPVASILKPISNNDNQMDGTALQQFQCTTPNHSKNFIPFHLLIVRHDEHCSRQARGVHEWYGLRGQV